jgi:hypothetical protein
MTAFYGHFCFPARSLICTSEEQAKTIRYDGLRRAPDFPKHQLGTVRPDSRRDKIPDFRWLQGRWLVAALDEITGYSAWDEALSEGGLVILRRSFNDPFNPPYDFAALLPLIRALQGGEVVVEGVHTETHEEVRLLKGFWVGEWRLRLRDAYNRSAATLQAQLNGELYGAVYLNPRLIVSLSSTVQPSEETTAKPLRANNHKSPAHTTPQSGAASSAYKPGPKPGVSGKDRVAELANEILRDEKVHIPKGRGRTTRLAELIHSG